MICEEDNKNLASLRVGKGIYLGKSSRSLFERTKEHHSDRESRKEESHQIKHWLTNHRELEEPPNFTFKAVQYFTDPMIRQIGEDRSKRRRIN